MRPTTSSINSILTSYSFFLHIWSSSFSLCTTISWNQQYHNSWSESHPKVWLSVNVVKEKVVKHSQFHVDHATSQALKEAGLPVADYDGGVNIWAANSNDLICVSLIYFSIHDNTWLTSSTNAADLPGRRIYSSRHSRWGELLEETRSEDDAGIRWR